VPSGRRASRRWSTPASRRTAGVDHRAQRLRPASRHDPGLLRAVCLGQVGGQRGERIDGIVDQVREPAQGAHHDGHVDVSDTDPGWGGAAGAMVSTAQDWSRFYTALMSGRLLPAPELAQLLTTVPRFPDQPDGPGYGLGIQTGATPCGTIWGHDGGLPGYLSANVTDRTGSRTATILVATESWSEFDSDPRIAEAAQALRTAAICTMLGQPVPTAAHTD
jgi:D-alanyl-D-alanine carboxypeptidase